MQHDSDPSVEEILESIKKVIARDNRDMARSQRKLRETRGMVDRDSVPEPAHTAKKAPSQPAEEEILDLSEAATTLIEDEDGDQTDPLTSQSADEDVRQSLSALSMLVGPTAKPRGPLPGENSLENMVREMLRPMLAEWLDANLPATVERLVGDEIDRIAGKKR